MLADDQSFNSTNSAITIVEFDLPNQQATNKTLDDFLLNENMSNVYWIHCNLSQGDSFNQLFNKLHLPSEIVKLTKNKNTMSHIIDTDETITVYLQAIANPKYVKSEKNHFSPIIVYMTHYYCLTISEISVPAISEFHDSFKKSLKYAKTPCFILFIIMDNIINDYAKFIFSIELKTDHIELMHNLESKRTYKSIIQLKKRVMKTKRYATMIREILMRLSSKNIAVISESCRQSLTGLFGHSQAIINEADSVREILNTSLDQINNSMIHKLNETMRVLTAFAAIFLPLTLITGIYGMNFRDIPELEWKYGYYYALTLLCGCAITLLIIFKKKKWF